ncbi:hypothetical protein [Saliphagus sp. LR7]|uniref:hypothetical protein n=1 Tax=Saliphagus sp. LR7 TaxID=2282654 RepID=UPI001300842F|nr:hypothetical protein [Saliphagus sp. LR7]
MPGSDNESANESGGGDGGGAGGLLDGITPSNPVPSIQETLENAWEWIANQFQTTMVELIDDVVNQLLGTPTIENDGAWGILGTPVDAETAAEVDQAENEQNGAGGFSAQIYTNLYNSVYLEFVIPLIGAVVGLMALTVLVGPALSAFTQRRMVSVIGSAALAVFLIVASWEFAALMHAFSDGVTQHFLPTGEEVMTEDRAAAGGPLAAMLGLSIISGSTSIALLAMHAVRHILLFLYPIVLPALFLLAYWGGHRRVKQTGSFFIWQWYGLLVWNWPTAVLLRAAYELEWTFHSSGLVNFAMTMGIFLIAVGLPIAISGSFGLIGMSMRGVMASTASSAFANTQNRSGHATAAEPSRDSRTRHAERRLKSGGANPGISAKSRAAGAYARVRSRFSRGSNEQSDPAPSRNQARVAPYSRKPATDGGVHRRSRSMSTGVTPAQRQRTNHKGTGSKPTPHHNRTNNRSTVIDDD